LTGFFAQQANHPDWTVGLFDGNKTVIARSRDAERFVGQRAARRVYTALAARSDTVFRSVTFDKVPVVTATAHSSASNWSLAVGVPEATFNQPLQDSMALLGGISVLCLIFGTVMAVRQASRLSQAELRQELLINELDHRVKNTLAAVQSIVRRTLRASDSVEGAASAIEARIVGLARAYDLLRSEQWKGTGLADLIGAILAPYATRPDEHVEINGPKLRLSSRATIALAMVFNELATNAAKYGALSRPGGKVVVSWAEREPPHGDQTRIVWIEEGGPEVTASTRRGFGTALIDRTIQADLGGSHEIIWGTAGLECHIDVPTRKLRS
jgi:two-component sensor histidine kinase